MAGKIRADTIQGDGALRLNIGETTIISVNASAYNIAQPLNVQTTSTFTDTITGTNSSLSGGLISATVTSNGTLNVTGVSTLANVTSNGTLNVTGVSTLANVISTGVSSFSGAQLGQISTLANVSLNVTPDFSLNNFFTIELDGNLTFQAPININTGQAGVIFLVQDGTGSRVASFNTYYRFPSQTAPTLTTTAGAVDMLTYIVKSSTEILCDVVLDVR
jgi:hypothetical protein